MAAPPPLRRPANPTSDGMPTPTRRHGNDLQLRNRGSRRPHRRQGPRPGFARSGTFGPVPAGDCRYGRQRPRGRRPPCSSLSRRYGPPAYAVHIRHGGLTALFTSVELNYTASTSVTIRPDRRAWRNICWADMNPGTTLPRPRRTERPCMRTSHQDGRRHRARAARQGVRRCHHASRTEAMVGDWTGRGMTPEQRRLRQDRG
jgi:hypothetical protein